jgi:hypothetical protein
MLENQFHSFGFRNCESILDIWKNERTLLQIVTLILSPLQPQCKVLQIKHSLTGEFYGHDLCGCFCMSQKHQTSYCFFLANKGTYIRCVQILLLVCRSFKYLCYRHSDINVISAYMEFLYKCIFIVSFLVIIGTGFE